MEIITVLFIATLHTALVQAVYINMTSCRSCSNRVDVPCHIQELKFHCLHDEFGGIWPGLPRNLRSRKVAVSNDMLAANFTWNAPYDASYKTLNGFLLTVNIAQDYIIVGPQRVPQPPRCFFANLSTTNWDIVPRPHSVLFHFDCVRAKPLEIVEVSLTLTSSPVPGEKSLTPLSAVVTLKPEESSYPEPDVFTINFTVSSLTVQVRFGPVNPDIPYRVCLSLVRHEYKCYKETRTSEGQDLVVFKNVEADTYIIYIQRLDNPDYPMYASKPFNVTEKLSLPAQPSIAPSIVAIITVGCLLFVAGVTTLCFCLMRERCHCLPLSCGMCSCFQYHLAAQSAPNNTNKEEDDSVLEILPIFCDESENFTLAVEKICSYLRAWSNCRVNLDWTTGFHSNQAVSFKEKHPNGVLLIVLSCKMWKLLNEVFYYPNFHGQSDSKLELFRRVLKETDGKPYSKIIVNLRPLIHSEKHLKGIKIFNMTKQGPRQNEGIIEMNTEELYLMLKLLNDEGNVRSGWAAYEELSLLHNTIKYVPDSDLFIESLGDIPADILDGYKQTVHLPSFTMCLLCHDRHGENLCPEKQKQEQTLQWARGCRNPYKISRCVPSPVYNPEDDQFMSPEDLDGYRDIESASVCQENTDSGETTQMANYVEFNLSHPDPKDDTESMSWSMLGQEQVKIYQGYKASLNDTKV